MSCICCTCEACKKSKIKTNLLNSMPLEVRNQTQAATADWFLNRLVDMERRLEILEAKNVFATTVPITYSPSGECCGFRP